MTTLDCEQQGFHYYEGQSKNAGKDEVARMITRQPLHGNLKSEPESARRESDTSVDVELCGSIWDNIDSKDGVVERSDERACERGVEQLTSESTE
jgi:predicted metal-dependent peptidase